MRARRIRQVSGAGAPSWDVQTGIGPSGRIALSTTEETPALGLPPAHLEFGAALAVYGNTVMASMPALGNWIGRVAILTRDSSGNWIRTGMLDAADGQAGGTSEPAHRVTNRNNRVVVTTSFTAALTSGDLQAVQICPKADLHTHGFANSDRDYLREKTGRDIAPISAPLKSMDEMHAWSKANLADLFDGPQGRVLWVEASFVRALKDGLTRIEFGDDVWMVTQGLGTPSDLVESITSIRAQVAPQVEWIPQLGLSRHCKLEWLQDWMAPWLELGFHRTLDLSGDELAQPIDLFKPLYRAAKAKGMRLKAHVGEWGTPEDVQHAVEVLELDEVQHGIAAVSSKPVMRFLADNRIRVNVCPTSNIMLGRVDDLRSHPIRAMYDAGVKVTVNTDDALVFGKTLSEEFLGLYQVGLFTAAELDQIRLNALTDQ